MLNREASSHSSVDQLSSAWLKEKTLFKNQMICYFPISICPYFNLIFVFNGIDPVGVFSMYLFIMGLSLVITNNYVMINKKDKKCI
jgi:hypothetical protein